MLRLTLRQILLRDWYSSQRQLYGHVIMRLLSGSVTVLVCVNTVLGFGLVDFLRAANEPEVKHVRRRGLTAPVDAIVELIQGMADEDRDGDISLDEIGTFADKLEIHFDSLERAPGDEIKGYMKTVGSLVDTDGDNLIQHSELERATRLLVSFAGSFPVGDVMDMKYDIPPLSYLNVTDAVVDKFMDVLDSNADGEVSANERDAVFGLHRFGWYRWDLERDVGAADQDGDGNLNEAESRSFIKDMYRWGRRRLMVYMDLFKLVGKDATDEWFN